MPGRDFSWALEMCKEGMKIFRMGWNGKGMYIDLQLPDENSKMTSPYLFIKTADGKFCPWVASQTDILATDWVATRTVGASN
jgi:hypothetical protein